jgi:predicted nucleic acid-binding protein
VSRVLVDTSVWIEHLRRNDVELGRLLGQALVLGHPYVRAEIALGSIAHRTEVLTSLGQLPQATMATVEEVLGLIDRHPLYGRGLGYVDAQLLASARLTPGARLWARDRRLDAVARELGIAHGPTS